MPSRLTWETRSKVIIRQIGGGQTVGWEQAGRVGRIILGGLLLVAFSGCGCWPRPRHGVIIRGDWSLELNRIPWLASRDDTYQEPFSVVADCATDCPQTGEASAGLTTGGPPAARPSPGETSCRTRRCRTCGQLTCAGPVQPNGAKEEYLHSRFHPVPTRPVFSTRETHSAHARSPELSQGKGGIDASGGPRALAPEPVPTPSPEAHGGWKAKRPRAGVGAESGLTSSPPVDLKLGGFAERPSEREHGEDRTSR
jgi:hypothetical protein